MAEEKKPEKARDPFAPVPKRMGVVFKRGEEPKDLAEAQSLADAFRAIDRYYQAQREAAAKAAAEAKAEAEDKRDEQTPQGQDQQDTTSGSAG